MLSIIGVAAMPFISHAETRRTETPNAVMTTLASPTQGGAGQAVWRVDMRAGAAGPPHAFDTEQIWTVLDGGATIELDGKTIAVAPGDTMVLPADVPRRVFADPGQGLAAIVVAPAGGCASTPDGTTVVPAWIV
jgi:quercetin dioxygenase-like cupin family protein